MTVKCQDIEENLPIKPDCGEVAQHSIDTAPQLLSHSGILPTLVVIICLIKLHAG